MQANLLEIRLILGGIYLALDCALVCRGKPILQVVNVIYNAQKRTLSCFLALLILFVLLIAQLFS
jgi:hypothetical protein